MAARDDDFGLGLEGQNLVQGLQTFGDPIFIRRQAKIEDHGLERAVELELFQRLYAGRGDNRFVRRQCPVHLTLQARVVLDQQDTLDLFALYLLLDLSHYARATSFCMIIDGNKRVIVVPSPSLLRTSISPPRSRIISRA